MHTFFYYFIVCYCVEIRFNSFNKELFERKLLFKIRHIEEIIGEHNRICNDIQEYDKFWRKYYFILCYTIIPLNLMFLQQLLFYNLIITSVITITSIIIGLILSHIILNLITASVNKNASKSHKYLFKIQNTFCTKKNIRGEIKV
jgi:hypothetical protein